VQVAGVAPAITDQTDGNAVGASRVPPVERSLKHEGDREWQPSTEPIARPMKGVELIVGRFFCTRPHRLHGAEPGHCPAMDSGITAPFGLHGQHMADSLS
jgi:hypothetical protein